MIDFENPYRDHSDGEKIRTTIDREARRNANYDYEGVAVRFAGGFIDSLRPGARNFITGP